MSLCDDWYYMAARTCRGQHSRAATGLTILTHISQDSFINCACPDSYIIYRKPLWYIHEVKGIFESN